MIEAISGFLSPLSQRKGYQELGCRTKLKLTRAQRRSQITSWENNPLLLVKKRLSWKKMVGDECCHVKELFFSNTKKILQEYKDNQLMKTSREIIAVLGTKEEYKCIRLQCGGCRPI